MNYYYLCELRPPGYAQVPDGFTRFEQWIPPHTTPQGRDKRFYHGWVSYERELPESKAARFALELVKDRPT